jgi:hypothetical protein
VTTSAERSAAYGLLATAGVDPGWRPHRTWHGVRITAGDYSGMTGFVVGRCDDCGPDTFRVLRSASTVLLCVPVSRLAPGYTLHGGRPCPGDSCTEGEPL